MKVKRLLAGFILTVSLAWGISGCGSSPKVEASANTQVPIDIIGQIAKEANMAYGGFSMDEGQKTSYGILLDGAAEPEARYYLSDITGDSVPELIMGKDMFTVYSYHQKAVLTIGTFVIDKAYFSEQYGLLIYYDNGGTYELRREQYDGELFKETVLVSESDETAYWSKADEYLRDGVELTAHDVTDRTPFE